MELLPPTPSYLPTPFSFPYKNKMFERLQADSTAADHLLRLFDFALLRTVTRGITSEAYGTCSKALVPLLTYRPTSWTFLNTLLNSEVEFTVQEECLFREESVASKVVSEFVHRFGASYLKETIIPCVHQLADACRRGKSYEVDPLKLHSMQPELSTQQIDKLVHKSRRLLMSQIENFLSSIFSSTKFLPVPLVILCKQLADAVSLKYFNRRTTALSGLLFLRFICPHLLTIPIGDFCKDSNHEAKTRRGLMLVAKVLQNLANGTICNESFMGFVNDYLNDQIPRRNQFFDEILQRPNEIDATALLQLAVADVRRQFAPVEVDFCVLQFTDLMVSNAFKIKKKGRSDGTLDRFKKVLSSIAALQREALKKIEEAKMYREEQTEGSDSRSKKERPADISLWTEEHVQSWLTSKGLTELRPILASVDGKKLITLVSYEAMMTIPELAAQRLPVKKSLKLEVSNLMAGGEPEKEHKSRSEKPDAWTDEDVEHWLITQELDSVVACFRANFINGSALLSLKEQDLQEIGVVALGTRKRLMKLITGLIERSEDLSSCRTSSSSKKKGSRRHNIYPSASQSSFTGGEASLERDGKSRSLPDITTLSHKRHSAGSSDSSSGSGISDV